MTGARSQFVQSTAFLPLPQLILIPVGLASIVSYFVERHELVAQRKQQNRSDPEQQRAAIPPRSRQKRALVVGFMTAFFVLLLVAVSLVAQFRREQVLARELHALEPYPGVIVMDTSFERAWLLSNKTAVRSEYSTTAGFMAISEYYDELFQKAGWTSATAEADLRKTLYCKGPYQARLEYPEQKLDLGYRYAVEIRVNGCG